MTDQKLQHRAARADHRTARGPYRHARAGGRDLRLIHKARSNAGENVQEAQGMIAWTRWLG